MDNDNNYLWLYTDKYELELAKPENMKWWKLLRQSLPNGTIIEYM